MQTLVRYLDLGHMPYQEAWDYQTALHRSLVDNKLKNRDLKPGSYPQAHHFLVVEHPPVYTLGKSGSMDHLLLGEDELRARGIQFYPINRGGDITFHGPGQIVGYPILDLECFFTDVHRYVRSIEEMVIGILAEYGIAAYRIAGYTGVWVSGPPRNGIALPPHDPPQRKICAIGVHLSRWVTLHGFAFNINTPLEYFRYIVPCGIADRDKTVTSLAQELGRPVDMQEVQEKLRRHFARIFECTWVTDGLV
ncbi:MAG TPA: lipoyl(octanoyl) transferase LipB [Saprospiraceae bacterium]|nr:lipoyl(octanoyl) transferase LipB [Saprospiraceae bacterium]